MTANADPPDPGGSVPPNPTWQNVKLPQTLEELIALIHLVKISSERERKLMAAVTAVFAGMEKRWQESKDEAIRALKASYTRTMEGIQRELSAKDASVKSISEYFERLVAELTDKSHRDSKTKLLNLGRFTDLLEAFLAIEQRGKWCAVGLVDINDFKEHNYRLGHLGGDKVIELVAAILREQIRPEDLLAHPIERTEDQPVDQDRRKNWLTARFGGDEFCFLLTDLEGCRIAAAVAERFREAVERYDWASVNQRLTNQPVRVDVGVACLQLGPAAARRSIARSLAGELIDRADQLMYIAKAKKTNKINLRRTRIENEHLTDIISVEESFDDKVS